MEDMRTEVVLESLNIIQLNMQHAKIPTCELFQDITNNSLACIQEGINQIVLELPTLTYQYSRRSVAWGYPQKKGKKEKYKKFVAQPIDNQNI